MSASHTDYARPLERPLTAVLALLAGAFAGLGLLATALFALGTDQVWLLYAGGRVLHHAQIYGAEVMESNPPFILWLSALPAALSDALHRSPAFGFRVCILLLSAAILAWCLVLLRHTVTVRRGLLGWAFAAAFFGFTFFLAHSNNIGQREHLLVLFMLPYLFGAALRFRRVNIPAAEAFLIGLSAAVGICCKVHHLLIVVGIELMLAIHRRTLRSLLRPEFFGVLTGGVAYIAAVQLFAPRYLHQVVPLLTQTYWAFGGIPLHTMVLQKRSLMLLLLTFACAAVAWALRTRLATAALQAALAAAAVCSLAAYWVQGTGFNYQLIPVSCFLSLAVVTLLADVATAPLRTAGFETQHPLPGAKWPPQPLPALPMWIAPTLAVLACVVTLAGGYHHFQREGAAKAAATVDPATRALLSAYPAGSRVALMSLDIGFFPSIADHNFFYAERFPHLWMMPAIVRTERHEPGLSKHLTPQQVADLTVKQDAYMVDDLNHWQPVLVGVERCNDPALETCEGMHHGEIDLLQFFMTDPAFAQAWSRYKFVESAGRYDFYALK
jgi:hypothetical protein